MDPAVPMSSKHRKKCVLPFLSGYLVLFLGIVNKALQKCSSSVGREGPSAYAKILSLREILDEVLTTHMLSCTLARGRVRFG